MIEQLHHFALVVEDLDAAVTWYRDMLDFDEERAFGFPEAGVRIAHLVTASGVRVELIEQQGSAPSPDTGRGVFEALYTRGVKHVGFLVKDIESTLAHLREKGVEVVLDVTTVEPAGVQNFWVRDNSGNLIEFNAWLHP